MPTISKTTNPTGLKELPAKLFTVRLASSSKGARSFWLEKFDCEASGLPNGVEISCVAHAGNAEEYFQLGTVDAPDFSANVIHELPTDRPLKFRFLFCKPGEPKLLAFADNVRAADESDALGESLIDIEPTDLNGPTWKLELPPPTTGSDRPVLLVERQLFPTAQAAANDMWVGVLVMPEVMRQVCRVVADNAGSLEDGGTWVGEWEDYFEGLGVPPLAEDSDQVAKNNWIEDVVAAFCAKASVRAQLKRAENELTGETV
jgi:hypothetical protein